MPTHQRLARFLFSYRNTPHTVTERTPAELFLRRQPRTRLTLLKPDLSETVVKHQLQQKKAHDRHTKPVRHFGEGERVKVRDFRHPKCQWNSGIILHCKGPLTYTVEVGQHQVSVNVDHLLRSNVSNNTDEEISIDPNDFAPASCSQEADTPEQPGPPPEVQIERRYPARQRKPPERLEL